MSLLFSLILLSCSIQPYPYSRKKKAHQTHPSAQAPGPSTHLHVTLISLFIRRPSLSTARLSRTKKPVAHLSCACLRGHGCAIRRFTSLPARRVLVLLAGCHVSTVVASSLF
ncbi:hypothetical protein BC567DRAFT_9139 [Phyllosticta citribraziliensis]